MSFPCRCNVVQSHLGNLGIKIVDVISYLSLVNVNAWMMCFFFFSFGGGA